MSYGDLAGANTYHAARGNTAWDGSDTVKTQALTRAQDYIRTVYVQRFAAGYDESATDVDSATYEAALIELQTPGFFSRTYTEAERKVLTKLDSIEWQLTGASETSRDMTPTSTKIEAYLWRYIARSYGAVVV